MGKDLLAIELRVAPRHGTRGLVWLLFAGLLTWGGHTVMAATNSVVFSYASRSALLADGWSFQAKTAAGVGRDTETTSGAVISYDQVSHPGTLRIPCDQGDLWAGLNNTRNSLFRNLSPDWTSIRLSLSFAPTNNFQQAQLAVYQDDDNYVEVGPAFNGLRNIGLTQETGGGVRTLASAAYALTNAFLRLDRDLVSGNISGYYSSDGTNWSLLGTTSQALVNPRLAVWVGGSDGLSFPACDLRRLDIITSDTPVWSKLGFQPRHLYFNTVAGQPCTNLQTLTVCRFGPAALVWTATNTATWATLDVTNGVDAGACNVTVDATGLAPGIYQSAVTIAAPGASNAPAAIPLTLIVNPPGRVDVATWRGDRSAAMTVWVDDGAPTAFDDLRTNNLGGTYVCNGSNAPAYYSTFYSAGMELGAHNFDHNCSPVDEATRRQGLEWNISGLCASTIQPCPLVVSFAWPCGSTSTNDEVIASDYFLCARGYNLNELEDPSPADFMNLKSFNSHEHAPYPPADYKTVLDAAREQGKWFNLVLHSYTDYDNVITYAASQDVWGASAGPVLKYVLQRDRTVISNYVEAAGVIGFDTFRFGLDPSSRRSFETAITDQDKLTFELDLTGVPGIGTVTCNGQPFTNISFRSVRGAPRLLLDTAVTGVPQRFRITVTTNHPPQFDSIADTSVPELVPFALQLTATDPDTNTLAFKLGANAPPGLTLSSTGLLNWTPGESAGPSTNIITIIVSDNGVPPLSATNSFTLVVDEVNSAPVLPLQSNRAMVLGTALSITNTATDSDIPANPLNYVLLQAPTNASISAQGVITWIPVPEQFPSTNVFTTIATDYNPDALSAQTLSCTNTFIVYAVTAIHNGPSLPPQPDLVLAELTPMAITNTALDLDIPALALTYELVSAPAGAVIDSNGVINWMPSEAQGPSTNQFTAIVRDNGSPSLSATNTFFVTVTETNAAPILPSQPDLTVFGAVTLTLTNAATDPDLPVNQLTYQLAAAPAGAVIDTNGVISWTPTLAQVPSTNVFTTVVTDFNPWAAASQQLSATNTFTVFVQTPLSPVLPTLPDVTLNEGQTLTVANTASDVATVVQWLTNTYVFNYASRSAFLADGWSMIATRPDGSSRNTEVTNAGSPAVLSFDQAAHPGVLRVPCHFGDLWENFNTATNCLLRALPANWARLQVDLTFLPVDNTHQAHLGIYQDDDNYIQVGMAYNAPLGGEVATIIREVGGFPGHAVVGLNSVSNLNFRLDRGALPGDAIGSYSLDKTNWQFIGAFNAPLVQPRLLLWSGGAPVAYTLGAPTLDLRRLDVVVSNVVPTRLTYTLVNPPSGATISPNGIISWAPTDAQGPSTNLIVTVVSDNSTPPLYATNSFRVVVNEINLPPSFPSPGNRFLSGLTPLVVTNRATDPDIPAYPLTYQLLAAPPGSSMTPDGVIFWTPSFSNVPGTYVFTTSVTDTNPLAINTQSFTVTNSFTVWVQAPLSPLLRPLPNTVIAEGDTLIVTNYALDGLTSTAWLTNTFLFSYANRTALLSDGWSFTATRAAGTARPTENTNSGNPAAISYDQGNHPGSIQIPCNTGDLWGTANSSSNHLFRSISSNWTSIQLDLSFVPARNYQQAHLGLYQDDDNYVQLGVVYHSGLGGLVTTMDLEIGGSPSQYVGSGAGISNLLFRLERGATAGSIRGYYSVNGTNWILLGTVNQSLVNPRLGIWTGGSPWPYTNGMPIMEIRRLDVVVSNSSPVVLNYALVNPPAGASIDENGLISWTPAEAQGPSTNTFITVVSDGGVPPLSATNAFTVTVDEINRPPVLPPPTNYIAPKLYTLVVTNAAADPDIPANMVSYQLVNPPAGAAIDSSGLFTWTPSVEQGPSSYVITVVATDLNPWAINAQSLSATNTFTVNVVDPVHDGPVLLPQTNQSIIELTTLSVTNTAATHDIPTFDLSYTLLEAPPGAVISPSGIIVWTPTEAQGPSTNVFTTRVVDNGTPPLAATNTFSVVVHEWNLPPVLGILPVVHLSGLSPLLVTNAATDPDVPANRLTYSLLQAPAGTLVDSNGVISWTPSVAQVPSTNTITMVVWDSNPWAVNEKELRATNTFTVVVDPVHTPPVLPVQTNRVMAEMTTLLVTNTASAANVPELALNYTLLAAPTGAVILPDGVIVWTPNESQGPSTNVFTTQVTDSSSSPLSDTNTFVVVVNEVNLVPMLPGQADRVLQGLASLTVTNTATDLDIPTNSLFYELLEKPPGASIDQAGVITWTPSLEQVPGTYAFTTVVKDFNPDAAQDNELSATNRFEVTVNAIHNGPTLPPQPGVTIAEQTTLVVTNTASYNDVPALPLVYRLESAPPNATIDIHGIITWSTTELDGPSTNVIRTVATDNGTPALSSTNQFEVVVQEVNSAPELPAQADIVLMGFTPLNVTNTATDPDLPANTLSYQLITNEPGYKLLSAPAGAHIDAAGVIAWTPAQNQVPSTNLFETVVTDYNPWATTNNRLSATNRFVVTVLVPETWFRITSVVVSNETVRLLWNSVPGRSYRVQYKDSAEQPGWTDLSPDVLATNEWSEASQLVPGVGARLYRVRMLP